MTLTRKPKRKRRHLMPSARQLWARQRNWNKRRLMGASVAISDLIHNEITTDMERTNLRVALQRITDVKVSYDRESIFSKAEYLRRHR